MASRISAVTETSGTIPVYHRDGFLTTHNTNIINSTPFDTLAEANRALFKSGTEADSVLTTTSTIFHPQGGGQPSDVGNIHLTTPDTNNNITFNVTSVRQDAQAPSFTVLHLGRYAPSSTRHFTPSDPVTQTLDAAKRHLYSRLHTAGHVLGLAVRHYLEAHGITDGVTDGKASHFPDMANVEFLGSIAGSHRAGIQAVVDEYVAADLAVEVCEWDAEELRDPANRVHMPENSTGEFGAGEGGRLRCVSIVGKGAYPCGGTHVARTGECGKVSVYKISRGKGVTRVSYSVD